MAPNDAAYKGMHKKVKQSKITAFFTVTPSTKHSTSIMLVNFQPETPTVNTSANDFLLIIPFSIKINC
jgi:hypothetical protein